MDDFNIQTMRESKNEYIHLFVNKISPLIMQGIYSIFKEAKELCIENDEEDKYLMTFQNFLGRTPKWNNEIVQNETNRIVHESGCNYLDDLLTCVHICELKLLTNIRVGIKQKKISLHIPKLNDFIHKVYIHLARKLYKNVFLFELNIPPLQRQKNLREFECICKESIVETIVASMPVEEILKTYLDETIEEYADETKEEVKDIEEEDTEDTQIETTENEDSSVSNSTSTNNESQLTKEKQQHSVIETNDISSSQPVESSTRSQTLQFNDEDKVKSFETNDIPSTLQKKDETSNFVSKEPDYLEKISNEKHEKRKIEEYEDEDEDKNETLVINDQPISLDTILRTTIGISTSTLANSLMASAKSFSSITRLSLSAADIIIASFSSVKFLRLAYPLVYSSFNNVEEL